MEELSNKAARLLASGDIEGATVLAQRACEANPSQYHSWYALGLCQRATHQYDAAVGSFERADRLSPNIESVLLALGIAKQFGGDLEGARETLNRLIQVHPDYALGYNSMGMTLKLLGLPEIAAEAYADGAHALCRNWVSSVENRIDSPRQRFWTSRHGLWIEYAMQAAMQLSARAGLDGIAWPTGEEAEREARTRSGRGWYWRDDRDEESGKRSRYFFPNYFNSLAAYLRADRQYSTLIGNRSTVLRLIGQHDDARQHAEEAEDFS